MAYNGGCLIGVEQMGSPNPINFWATNSSLANNTPTTILANAGIIAPTWQTNDGAWQPEQPAYVSQASNWNWAGIIASCQTGAGQALLVTYRAPPIELAPTSWSYYSYPDTSTAPTAITPTVINLSTSTTGRFRRLVLDMPFAYGQYFAMEGRAAAPTTYRGARWGEVSWANLQEIPNNQELVSYKRALTAPTAVEVKTMEGAIRRYITGPAGYNISATWRWSDNGTVAANLTDILTTATNNARPLVVYIPAGIYYDGAHLDLVVPTNDPAVTMPAPGVYELTIEGTCQP